MMFRDSSDKLSGICITQVPTVEFGGHRFNRGQTP